MKFKNTLLAAAVGLLSVASASTFAAEALSLQGKTVGVAVVGTQHFWDREAFKGATAEVEKLGGKVIAVDGGRDNQVHANNHDILLSRKVDAVISILGDSAVEPKFKALRDAGIPVFTVDHVSPHSVNNLLRKNSGQSAVARMTITVWGPIGGLTLAVLTACLISAEMGIPIRSVRIMILTRHALSACASAA